MRKSSPPTVTPDPSGKRYNHPSYGVVQITRCSGNTELFDSSFTHQHYIALSAHKAEKVTDGSHDFIHPKEKLIEVWMSEAQFARAITSMNLGSGSPCTIARVGGKSIDAPEAEDLQKSHTNMVKEKLSGQLTQLEQLGTKIIEMRDRKHRPTLTQMDDIAKEMGRIAGHFESNMVFYAGCMEEHMEEAVAAAKSEIEVHLMTSAKRLGIPQDEIPQLELPDAE